MSNFSTSGLETSKGSRFGISMTASTTETFPSSSTRRTLPFKPLIERPRKQSQTIDPVRALVHRPRTL